MAGEVTDPRQPCLVGVATRTWHPDAAGGDAPEPLTMWAEVVRAAAADATATRDPLARIDALDVIFCQSWPYDAPAGRLAAALGIEPRNTSYSGIGGTTGQTIVNQRAAQMLAGELDAAVIVGAEALATAKRITQRGERPNWSHRDPEKRPFPFEAPFHPSEVAHEVFQAWLTFATWDNARRAARGTSLAQYSAELGELFAPFTEVAASNPEAWFRIARSASELVTVTPANRMVGYPYPKLLVSMMDVDMAAALLLVTRELADEWGVPADQRVYLRGWCSATDPVYVAEHDVLDRSPAMAAASSETLRGAGAGIDDVAHLDLYSCFPSSVNFACDALGIVAGVDGRALTVTGGLPYHGGPGSNYLTHSIAAMARTLRRDPGALGLVSGVGMHMTKHVYGAYSTTPGELVPPDEAAVQVQLDAAGKRTIVAEHAGVATVASYSVVHGRDAAPEWGLLVCDLGERPTPGAPRAYARLVDAGALADAEVSELVGRSVELTPSTITGPMGDARVNLAALV